MTAQRTAGTESQPALRTSLQVSPLIDSDRQKPAAS